MEQGDAIRLRFQATGMRAETEVEALVWYDHPAPRSRRKGLRHVGCVVPDRAQTFLDLFAEVERRNGPLSPLQRVARPTPRPARSAGESDAGPRIERAPPARRAQPADLPRHHEPGPPPKPPAEESLPRFRVRLRQLGGSRTRCVTVHACSMERAAEQVRGLLVEKQEADLWVVLEVSLVQNEALRRG